MPARTTMSPATQEVAYKTIQAAGTTLQEMADALYKQFGAITGISQGHPGSDELCAMLRFEVLVTYSDITGSYSGIGTWYLLKDGSW